MTEMPAALEFESVSKEYRSVFSRQCLRALDGFDLRVEAGEIFGFLGPNGAGKSTAIHIAMGFMRPTSGQGHMLGRPFGDAWTRRHVGFLAENVALYHRRVDRLLCFYGALNRVLASGRAKFCRWWDCKIKRNAMRASSPAACYSERVWRKP